MSRPPSGRPPEPPTRSLPAARGRPRIVVIAGATTTTHVVPLIGEVTVGRDPGCEIRIDDASVSRRHAKITVRDVVTVEDLGSTHGTSVGGTLIAPRVPTEIRYDDVITVGTASVVVQQNAPAPRTRAVWGHGYFELRLTEECTRAARATTGFGLLRVRAADRPTTVEKLAAAVREIDVVSAPAPGEWEVLLVDARPAETSAIAAAVRSALPEGQVGLANFPADGHDAWALSSTAASRVGNAVAARTDAPASINPIGPMQSLLALVERVARGEISVLVLGETGAGKEIVAEEIHRRSPRAKQPLVKLNCAALPEQLLESELFGHEKGAFTGAVAAKPGLLETAEGGTVFLDEIGELPPATQVKLLRALEQREILRVGATKPKRIDIRFVAATHRDIEGAIRAGTFREDLYFRLAAVTIHVPPLRERTGEIAGLLARFVAIAAANLGRQPPEIDPAARDLLHAYRWPGNVRELRNVIERATLLCDETIRVEHLPADRMTRPTAIVTDDEPLPGLGAVRAQAEALERKAIADALAQTGGNQTKAARILGISRRTLTTKLGQYGFERPRKR